LKNERKYTVAESGAGIYTVTGDILPIRLIDSRELSYEENLWLKSLDDGHDGHSFLRIDKEIIRKGKTARLGAYLYAIIGANREAVKEARKMGKKMSLIDTLANKKKPGITPGFLKTGKFLTRQKP